MYRRFIVSLTLSRNFFASVAVGAAGVGAAQLEPLTIEALMTTEQRTRLQILFLMTSPRSTQVPAFYLMPNTQIAPPSGTSGKLPGDAALRRACMARESMPQPACTAMNCLPAIMNDVGGPVMRSEERRVGKEG